MTRFILFFTFIKIFLSYPSFAATEELINPTHTVLKHTFTTLNRWSALPDRLTKSLIEHFRGSFAELDALNAFEEVTRGILKDTPSLSRKAFADRTKEALQNRYSIESRDEFLFPIISRSIAKEALLDSAWKALAATTCGKIIVEANRGGTLKDSMIFYGLFSASHEEYCYNDTISGFMVIKNFFLATASDAPLTIRPGFMGQARELGLAREQLLTRLRGSSAYTSLTDARSARTGSLSITPVDMEDAFAKESSDSSPDSSHAQAGGGGGEGRAASPASFSVDSPCNQDGVVTPKNKRKERGKPGSTLSQPLLGPNSQDSTNYTDPDSAPKEPAKQRSCCSIL